MDIVWDFDYIKYTIGSIAEKRSILVTNIKTGDQESFDNRTQFYGHWSKKNTGWLAEHNKNRIKKLTVDDFTIEDVQTPLPLSVAINAVDNHINGVLEKLDAKNYYGYIGKGDSWRVEASTILKYKGSREGTLKPLHLPSIEKHLVNKHGAEYITYFEADDKVVMDCTENPELILVGVDKDYRGCALTLFNPDKMGEPEKIKGFGKLYIGSDKKVRGEGRIFLYHQILSEDSSDCYAANSASDVKWGEKSSYAVLSKCSDDKQALQGMVEAYKKLYPEPKTITGWRGDTFEIDWFYVMNENFQMAHMLRNETDFIDTMKLLTKLGITI